MKASIICFFIAVSAYTVLSKPTFTVIGKTAEGTGTLNFETIFDVLTCAFSDIGAPSDDTSEDTTSEGTASDNTTSEETASDATTSEDTTTANTSSDNNETAE